MLNTCELLIIVEVGISAQLWFSWVCLNVLIKFYKEVACFKNWETQKKKKWETHIFSSLSEGSKHHICVSQFSHV